MASAKSYPKLSQRAWQTLRARAAAAPTTRLTPTSVAALLGMASPQSAADNVVYPMRRVGLIDEDGALTARGNKWRVDATYHEACQEIIDEHFPAELGGLKDADGTADKSALQTWFTHQGFGGSNASQMAATYVMLADPTPPGAPTSGETKDRSRKSPAPAKRVNSDTKTPAAERAPAPPEKTTSHQGTTGPVVHLDIQVHIPADASAEQIDHIFSSMAKHLYGR